jgi:tetratricopeptide (TPR) repeat protein
MKIRCHKFTLYIVPRIRIFLSFFVCLLAVGSLRAQTTESSPVDNTPRIHSEFPFQMLWDDAVLTAAKSGKPTVVFDLDLIDSASIKVAHEVMHGKHLQRYIKRNFEPALNDFASDPPPSVGLDSLRNLGWRLSGLEKTYGIAKRPCIIVIGKNKQEIDRIVQPEALNATELEHALNDILTDRNTLHSEVVKFWKDSTNLAARWKLIAMFTSRSKYDSVIRHLNVIMRDKKHAIDARRAWLQLGIMRMQVEGVTLPLKVFIGTLSHAHGEDTLGYGLIQELIKFYETKRQPDSVIAMYEKYYAFRGAREADMLNEEAWYLANKSSNMDAALKLIDEAIAQDPQNPNYLDTRAIVETHLERYDDAILDEEKALMLAPKSDKEDFKKQLQQIKSQKQQAEADKAEDSKDASKDKH